MKTHCPSVSLSLAPPATEPRLLRGIYASLERLINTAGFVAVDLTDTVFIAMHAERTRAAEPQRLSGSE